MSVFDERLLVSVEHGEKMHQTGLVYGRSNAMRDVIFMLIKGGHADAAQAVIDMQKDEVMTSEQYEADAKADHRTDV